MNPIWREILLITLFSLGAICLVIGLLLFVAPQRFLESTARLNRWISTEAAFESLDRSRPADRYFYRLHLWVGTVLVLGSLYIIYTFWAWYDRALVLPKLPVIYNPAASAWIYDSLVVFLRGAGVVGLVSGIVVLVRPSLLKSVEAWGNRWVATERWTRPLDQQKDLPPQWFPGRARWFGLGISLGSLYVMLRCGSAIWGLD
ncbi:MAG: hypothetical protein HYR49_07215 [Gammaproteobacteria bacterium]|nr:hypothetical protein [Gammaproteobacteria bacterium]